jgi:hypothetical protein
MKAGDVEGVPSVTSMTTLVDSVPNGIGLTRFDSSMCVPAVKFQRKFAQHPSSQNTLMICSVYVPMY